MEAKTENKIKMRIYEDQTKISNFIEPEWVEKFKKLVKLRVIEHPRKSERRIFIDARG